MLKIYTTGRDLRVELYDLLKRERERERERVL